jgi:hypothetical protein
MAVTAAELIVLVRAEGVAETASALAGLSASADGAALGLGALAIAGAATIGALGASVAAASSFQTTLQNVQNNTTMTTAQVGAMRESVLKLGSETGAPLEQLTGGFMHAMNITGDLSASMDILKIATESAVSTGGKASDTTNILANAMHEYGADVSHAATEQERHNEVLANATRYMGIFHLASAEGNMTLEDFANNSGKSVAAAANLHVPVEQVAAAFSALTRHGFDAATANTQLSNILFHMAAPSKAAAKELGALSKASGVDLVSDFSAAGLASKGLDGVMTDLQTAFAKTGRSTQDQSALLATLDGSLESTKQKYLDQGMSEAKATEEAMKLINAQRGGLGLAVLMGTANEDYKNSLHDMTNQQLLSTVTQDAFNRSAQTAGFQFARLKVNMQELAITLGSAALPGLTQLLTAINLVFPAVERFVAAHASMIAAVMAAAGSFAVLVAAHALLAPSIGAVMEALGAVTAVLTGPFALALLAGGLLVRAYATNWHGFGTAVNGAVDVTKAALTGLVAAFRTGDFNAAFGTIITAVDNAFGAVATGKVTRFVSTSLRGLQLFRDTVITITEALRGEWVPSAAIQPFVNAVGIATTKARELAEAARALLAPALAFLREHFLAISTVVGVAISALLGMPLALLAVWTGVKLLAVAWAEDFHGIREITATVAAAIGTVLATLGGTFSTLGTAVRGALDAAGARLSTFGTLIHDTLGNAVTVAVSAVGATFSTLGTTVSGALSTVGGAFSAFGTTIHNSTAAIRDLASTIGAGLHGALTALAGILGTVGAAFGATSGSATAISAAFQAIGTAARTSVTALGEVATALANIVRQGVGGYLTLLGMAIQPLLPLLGQLAQFLGGALVVAIGVGMGAIGGLAGFLTNTLAGALRIVTGTLEIVSGGIQIFAAILTGVINVVTDLIHGNWTAAWHDAGTALSKAFDGMKMQVLGLADVLLGAFQTMFGSILGAVGGFGATVVGYFADVYQKTTGQTAPWAAGMTKSFQDLSTQSIGSTQQMHDQLVHLLDIGPQVSASTAAIGSGANEMVGPMNSATGATGSFTDHLRALLSGTSAAPASFGNLSGGVKALASSMDAGAAAAAAYDKAIQSLGSTGGQLKGYLATLQAQWDALNVATANGTNVNAQQAASFAQLAGPIQYINAQLGINQQQTTAATLAAVNHMQAVNGAAAADNTAANAAMGHGLALGAQAAAAVVAAGATAASGVAAQMASGQVSNLTTTINAVPKAVTTAVSAPGATEATGQVNAVTAAVATVPKSFTVTAVVDTSAALAAIANLDAHMPHSPAKTGPFSTLPNWNALFSALPAAFNSAGAAFDAFGATVGPKFANAGRMAVQGLTNGMNALGSSAADAATGMAAGVNDAVVNFFEIASPSKKTHAHGRAVAQGLTNGIAAATPAAAKAAADLAVSVAKGITDTLAAMHLLSTYDFATGSPSGGQFAMLGTLTAHMVATIQDAAKGFGDAGLKATTLFAEAAGKVGGMIKNVLTGLADLAAFNFAKSTPTAEQFGMLTTLTVSLVQTIQDAAAQFNDLGLKSATLFAEAAGKVGGMVKNALAALSELASFDFAKNTPTGSAMGLFRQMITDVVLNIQQAATAFSDEGIKSAAAFAESATKVMGLIVAGVGAFEKLAAFVAPPAAAIYAFGKALRAALNDLALVAEQVTQDAAASAAKFAESASKVVGMLGTGVAAFAKLTTFQAVPLAAVYAFGKALRATINDFALLAEQITPDATRAAALFAEGAGKVVGIIGAGVDAFTKLADFAAPAASAIYAFGKTLRAVIDDLALVAEQVTQQATDSAAKFASGATTVLAVFGNGIAGLMDLAKFVAPSQKAIDDFAYAIGHLVERFANAARMIGEQGVVEAGKFGTAAKLAVDTIKVGLEAFTLFKHMVVPSAEAIDTLVAGVSYVVGRFRDMADAMGHDALTKAQAFGTAVEHTAKSIQTAIGTFKSLTEPPFKGALTKIMKEFNGDFDQSLAMMIEAHGKAAQFETEARMYKEAMLNAATSIAAGNAALANAALPGSSLGRDMKAAGQNLGDVLHDAVRDTLQIKSPSQVMVAVGQQVVAGLVGGMSSTQQDAVKKAAELAKAVADAVIVTLTSLRALGNLNSAALPSGDQVGGFLASTMQVVDAVAAAASAMNGKALDAAVKFAEGAGKVLGFVGSGVDALAKLATAVLPSTAAIYGLGKLIQATVNDFAVMAEAVGTAMLGSAVEFATGAGAVAEAVGKGVAGLAKLADFVTPPAAAIYAMDKVLRLAIQDFAALADLVGKDMLAQAVVLAEGAGKVAEAVGKGVAGLAKLADFVAPPAAAVYAFGKTIRLLVADFAAIGDLVGNDATAGAARFAEGAGKVVAIVGGAVDGFTKLAAYKGIADTLITPFVETVRTIVAVIGQAARQFTTDGLTLAGQFADAAAKSVGILSNGVDGFTKLRNYRGVGDAAIGAFVATVTTLVQGIGAASQQFTADALTHAGQFADTASKVVGLLASGVAGFAALAKFTTPTSASIGEFIRVLTDITARLTYYIPTFADGQLVAAQLFADTASKVIGLIGAGVDGFAKLATLVTPSSAAIGEFIRIATDMTSRFTWYAPTFATGQLAAASLFADTASKVLGIIGSGVAGFAALAGFVAPSDVAIAEFVRVLTAITARLTYYIPTFAAGQLQAAQLFADTAGKVAGIIGAGVTGFNALADFRAPTNATIDAFAASVGALVGRIAGIAASFSADGLAAAGLFGDAAGKVLAVLGNGVSGLTGLFAFVAPPTAALDAFAASVQGLVARFGWLAATLSGDGLTAAQTFATAAGAVFGALTSATGFFKSLDNLLLPDLAGINRILAPITATIDAVLGVAARFGTAGLTAAQQFAVTVGAIFGAMQTATTALGRPGGTGGLGLPATGGGGYGGGGGGLTVNLTFNAPILGVTDFNNAVVAAVVEAERRGRL